MKIRFYFFMDSSCLKRLKDNNFYSFVFMKNALKIYGVIILCIIVPYSQINADSYILLLIL